MGKYLVLAMLLIVPSSKAMERAYGDCSSGGVQVNIPAAGLSTTNTGQATYWQQSFPTCTVTVYLSGITSLSITSITRSSNIVTATLSGSYPTYGINASVTVSGSSAGFNGTFTVTSVPASNKITWNQTGSNTTSSGGTVSPLAAIYSDNIATPMGNPFTSDNTGHWFFYAVNGRYDVARSGIATLGDVLLYDPPTSGTASCSASSFIGSDLSAQTAAAFASGCLTVFWSGGGTFASAIPIPSGGTIQCTDNSLYTETGGTSTIPTAIEILSGTTHATISGCHIKNNQNKFYHSILNVPSSAIVICSRAVFANCDSTGPDSTTNLTVDALRGNPSVTVTSVTGLSAGQDIVLGMPASRGSGIYTIASNWNGSNPVTLNRPVEDNCTVANQCFVGWYTNGFARDWLIKDVTITGSDTAGETLGTAHGVFISSGIYGHVNNLNCDHIGGRCEVANGFSGWIDINGGNFPADGNQVPQANGWEPCYVNSSHCTAENIKVTGATSNCIAVHGLHSTYTNLTGTGCLVSGLQVDTSEDTRVVGGTFNDNAVEGINVEGDPSFFWTTVTDLVGVEANGNGQCGVQIGNSGNVNVHVIGGWFDYNFGTPDLTGVQPTQGGGVCMDNVQQGTSVVDAHLCGNSGPGIFADGSNDGIVISGDNFAPDGTAGCTAPNGQPDIELRTGHGNIAFSQITNLVFGVNTNPIRSADVTTLIASGNYMWGFTAGVIGNTIPTNLNNLGTIAFQQLGLNGATLFQTGVVQSATSALPSVGFLRLGEADQMDWGNIAATGNLGIGVVGNSGFETFGILGSGAVTPGFFGVTVPPQSFPLPSVTNFNNGTFFWCTNCAAGSKPCTGSSTGAWAFLVQGPAQWNCPF